MTTSTRHGDSISAQLAGVLPRTGVNILIGDEKSGKSSIAADIAVAIAAGDAGGAGMS